MPVKFLDKGRDSDLTPANIKAGVNIDGVVGQLADINSDPDFVAGNIKKGVDIVGVVGTHEAGGMSIPNQTSFTSKFYMANDENGNIYLIDNSVAPNIGRVYDKNMNLIRNHSWGASVFGIGVDTYALQNGTNAVFVYNLQDTQIANISKSYIGTMRGVIRYNSLMSRYEYFNINNTNGRVEISDFTGTILTMDSGSGMFVALNKKNNFVAMYTSSNAPINVLKFGEDMVMAKIQQIQNAFHALDLQNW